MRQHSAGTPWIWPAIAAALLLVACAGPGQPRPAHVHDLGLGPRAVMDAGLAGAVQVIAPAWLRSSAMQYRLAYQSASERHAYLESRWAAPPAELVYGLLSRTLSGAGGCRLEVDLDEFIHDFPAADRSDGVVEARARLRAPGHGRVVASRSFSLRLPAPSPDAAGGVAALGRGSGQLAGELGAWLAQLGADPRNHKACTLP